MRNRFLGTTSLQVSALGLGLAALGRPGYINLGHADDLESEYHPSAMEARAFAVLDAAWAAGVRYFDAARSYGEAEAFLGRWLKSRNLPSPALVVGSKWGYTYTAEWQIRAEFHEVKEHTLEVLQRQWQQSRDQLGRVPDLYQIHSATLESGVLENAAVLNALGRFKDQGVAIGLSVSGPRQDEVISRALDLTPNGRHLFDCVQATWNLLAPSAGEALARARECGLGVIVKEALANGRLTPRNTAPDFAPKMTLLQQQARRLGTTVDGLAIAAAMAQPWANVVLSGAARVEHLQSNLGALKVPWDEEAAVSLQLLREPVEAYWQTRAGLEWN